MLDSANYADPLDVLRRFVPTPLRTRFRAGTTTILVESNDFLLLPALPLDSGPEEFDPSMMQWKLVRDSETHGQLEEPLLLSSGQLTIVAMGAACLLGVDHERRELLCFVGADVDARTFQDVLVPFLCRLSTESAEVISGNNAEGPTGSFSDA